MSRSVRPAPEIIAQLSSPDFAALFECSPVAQVVMGTDPEFTVAAVSETYLALSGVRRQELVGRGLFQVLRLRTDSASTDAAESVHASFCRALAAKVPDKLFRQRVDIAAPAGGFEARYFNTTTTPVLASDGSVSYLLHSVEEVTETVLAEEQAQAAKAKQQVLEEHFYQLAEVSGMGIMMTRAEQIIYANNALLNLLGYTQEDVTAGRLSWDKLTPPEYAEVDRKTVAAAAVTGKCPPFEKAYIAKSGRRIPVLVGAALLNASRREAFAFVIDLTERKKNQADAFLVQLDDATRSLSEPDDIISTALRLLRERLDTDACGYCTFEQDEQTFHLQSVSGKEGVPPMQGTYKLSDFGEESTRFMRENITHAVSDAQSDSHNQLGVRAFIATPLHKNGKLIGSVFVCRSTPRIWWPAEIELVNLAASRCWESLQRAQAVRELRESEQRLRMAQQAARIGSFESFLKEGRVVGTAELENLYGLQARSFQGKFQDWLARLVPEDANRVMATMNECFANKQTECAYEFRALLPEGGVRWLRARTQVIYDADGQPERMVGVNIDIDNQMRAQAELQEREQRLRAIFDGTHEHIGLLTPEGTLLETNRASLEFTGSRREDAVGRPFWEGPWFAHNSNAAELVKHGVARAAAGEFVRYEATLRSPSGTDHTFDVSLHPIRNAGGEVIMIVPEGRDITERKKIEQQLREQWQVFDTALSNTPDITYTFDPQGRFTYANRQLVVASQRSLQDTVGKTVNDLNYPPELAERISGQVKRVVEQKQTVRDQTPFRLPTGEWREYEYIYVPVLAEDGSVRAVAGASRDITDRILAEKQLRESEAKFRQLIDSMPQLVWSSDGHGSMYNKKWLEYTGLTAEESRAKGWSVIHPDDLAESVQRWAHSLRTGDTYQVEYRCKRFDGEYRWFLARATSVRDEQGSVLRWFGTCTDIHEQKMAEAELRRAHRELEEFSYVASHDLQEPLRMVNIYAHLIVRQIGEGDGALSQYATFVRQGVTRMEALLKDLLNYSRAVHTEALPVGQADLGAALVEALAVLDNRIQENGALITASALPTVRGDTAQLAHVFQNLISNSLKYRKKDVSPQITISADLSGGIWKISLRDNGIGFEPAYAERIFGLFKRLHKEEYPGTGLGLAICKRIVERYGGRMWAEGTLGEGAVFYFSLPAIEHTAVTEA